MAKRKTKSTFIGLKVTSEQAETLAQLQKALNSPTKTAVLLRGLELLASSSLPPTPPAQPTPRAAPQIATSLELSQIEADDLVGTVISRCRRILILATIAIYGAAGADIGQQLRHSLGALFTHRFQVGTCCGQLWVGACRFPVDFH